MSLEKPSFESEEKEEIPEMPKAKRRFTYEEPESLESNIEEKIEEEKPYEKTITEEGPKRVVKLKERSFVIPIPEKGDGDTGGIYEDTLLPSNRCGWNQKLTNQYISLRDSGAETEAQDLVSAWAEKELSEIDSKETWESLSRSKQYEIIHQHLKENQPENWYPDNPKRFPEEGKEKPPSNTLIQELFDTTYGIIYDKIEEEMGEEEFELNMRAYTSSGSTADVLYGEDAFFEVSLGDNDETTILGIDATVELGKLLGEERENKGLPIYLRDAKEYPTQFEYYAQRLADRFFEEKNKKQGRRSKLTR